jgi:hypothetical protein
MIACLSGPCPPLCCRGYQTSSIGGPTIACLPPIVLSWQAYDFDGEDLAGLSPDEVRPGRESNRL